MGPNFIYIIARFYSERGHTEFLCVTNLLSVNLLNPACSFYQCIYEPSTNQSCGIIFHFLATVTVSRVFRATKREPGNTEQAETRFYKFIKNLQNIRDYFSNATPGRVLIPIYGERTRVFQRTAESKLSEKYN